MPARVAALAGLLGGAAALTTGEVLGRVVPGAAPPLVALGDLVVRAAPPWLRDGGIEAFGTADKPVLLGCVALVVGLLCAATGVLARRRPREAEAVVVLLAGTALLAQLSRTGTARGGAFVAAAASAVVGVLALRLLLGRSLLRAPALRPEEPLLWSRRSVLVRSAGVLAVTTAGGALARLLGDRVDVERIRLATGLPTPVAPAPGDPVAAALRVDGITPLVTPTRDFYRIDTALVVPAVDPASWSLRVDGFVDRPLQLSYADLLAMPQTEAYITMQCVSNEVGGDLVGNARWQGVLLRDVLDRAGVQSRGRQVMTTSVDGWTAGFPTEVLDDGRPALIALGMNGEPLPQQHGFPARLVVPGLYGYVSATKWVTRLELTTSEADGFWVPRGWSKLGPVKIASRIDVPQGRSRVAAGEVVVAGVAWSPGPRRGVTKVEVRADGGPWREALLSGALSENTWRQWRATVPLEAGEHLLQVRATDRTGAVQDERRRPVRPDGATGYHQVVVTAV